MEYFYNFFDAIYFLLKAFLPSKTPLSSLFISCAAVSLTVIPLNLLYISRVNRFNLKVYFLFLFSLFFFVLFCFLRPVLVNPTLSISVCTYAFFSCIVEFCFVDFW